MANQSTMHLAIDSAPANQMTATVERVGQERTLLNEPSNTISPGTFSMNRRFDQLQIKSTGKDLMRPPIIGQSNQPVA